MSYYKRSRRPQAPHVRNEFDGKAGLTVAVRDNNIDQALRVLKKRMHQDGSFREMRKKQHYMKPSEADKVSRAKTKSRWEKQRRKEIAKTGESKKPSFGPI